MRKVAPASFACLSGCGRGSPNAIAVPGGSVSMLSKDVAVGLIQVAMALVLAALPFQQRERGHPLYRRGRSGNR
jgi:hypothetical protein